MANPIYILLGAIASIAVIGFITIQYPESSFSFLKEHGKALLSLVQIAGLFYAGYTSNIKLGIVLAITLGTTILWGW